MKMHEIPFNKPFMTGNELQYITEAVRSGKISGDGAFTNECHRIIESLFSARKCLLTTSCTSALEMAAILINADAEDEIIVPSYTFVSTVNAFVLRGARPRFVDIRPDTLNMDEKKIESALTGKTKAIVVVHYAGVSADMDPILGIAKKHQLKVIEDAAQGFNAKYKNRFLGTIGDMGAYSFHETKNLICGEGGAIVINDDQYIERAEIIREKGTNRSKFFRGEIDRYTWVDIGSSFLPSEVLSAFLYAQLQHLDAITAKRRDIYENYYDALEPLQRKGVIRLPIIPPECSCNYSLFYILLEDEKTRDNLIRELKKKSILSVFHYVPLHTSPYAKSLGYNEGELPVTESMAKRLLRLPLYFTLTAQEQGKIIDEIGKFFQ